MKNKLLLLLSLFAVAFGSCKKDDQMVTFQSATNPVLTASSTTALVLTNAAKDNNAIAFRWNNPNYRFSTGVSSQDVTYTLQVDTTSPSGNSFSSSIMQESSVSKDLGVTYTVKDLNAILTKMNLVENMPHSVEFRLKASLVNGALPLYSNVIKMMITPYLDVAVPIPAAGNLWLTGDAVSSGYANPLTGTYATSQKFTKISSTLFQLTVSMLGGGAYKLLQDNGDWSTQYHMTTGTWNTGSFEKKDSDPGFPGPPSPGTYKITVNFKTGIYTVEKQ
jgi:hypothetical protein